MVTSRLLNLPSEIRNRIFEYALTSDEPLACMLAADGMKVTLKLVDSRQQFMGFRTNKEDNNYGTPEPVYRRVDDVLLGVLIGNTSKDHSSIISYNQLQFVNRQIRKETQGLELKYNIITCTHHDDSALEELTYLSYFLALAPSRIPWLRRLQFTWYGDGDEYFFKGMYPGRIFAFCRLNPQAQVLVILVSWTAGLRQYEDPEVLELDEFFDLGLMLSMHLRNDKSMMKEITPPAVYLAYNSNEEFQQWFTPSMEIMEQARGLTNLLFKPNDFLSKPPYGLVDDKIPANWYYLERERQRMDTYPEEQQKNWIKWIKLWTEEGIRPNIRAVDASS